MAALMAEHLAGSNDENTENLSLHNCAGGTTNKNNLSDTDNQIVLADNKPPTSRV